MTKYVIILIILCFALTSCQAFLEAGRDTQRSWDDRYGGDKSICQSCGAVGTVTCSKCGGKGSFKAYNEPVWMKCQTCNGQGKVTCSSCNGSGRNQ